MHHVKKYLFIFSFLFIFFCLPTKASALTRSARLYYFDSNNQPQIYYNFTQQQITNGQAIQHQTGSYPSALSFRYDDYTYSANTDYIITTSFTIESNSNVVTFTDYYLSISYWNSNDGYDTQVNLISSGSCGSGCYERTYSITSKFKPTSQVTSAIQWLFFTYSRYVTYLKVNSYSIDKTSSQDSSAIISNNNQNTANIINNNNQNTEAILDGLDDLNDTLSSSSTDNNLASRFLSIFSHNDHALASIVTAPVNFMNSLDDQCQPITLPITLGTSSNNIVLPCGDTLFWGRSDVSDFRLFWNTLFGGALIYALGFSLFKTINRALDPFVDDINGLEV